MPELRLLPAILYLLVGGLSVLLGGVVLRDSAGDRIRRVTGALLLLVGLKAVYEGLGLATVGVAPGPVPDSRLLRVFGYLWEFFFPTLVLFAAVFPQENIFLRRFRLAIPILYLPHTFHFLVLTFLGEDRLPLPDLPDRLDYLRVPYKIGGYLVNTLLSIQFSLFSLVNLGYIAAAVGLLFASFRATTNPRLRNQLNVIINGLGTCVLMYAIAEPIRVLAGLRVRLDLRHLLVMVALAFGVGGIAYSIVRHRFLDTQILLRRSILYAVVSGLLAGVYLFGVRTIQGVMANATHIDPRVIEPVFLVLALILFQPTLIRLEELVDGFFLRDRHDPRNLLRQLSHDIITILDRRDLTNQIVRTLSEGVLSQKPVLLDLAAPPGDQVVAVDLTAEQIVALENMLDAFASLPVTEEFAHRDQLPAGLTGRAAPVVGLLQELGIRYLLPIRHGGRRFGFLLLGRKVTGVSYSAEEVSLLVTLANQVGVALQNAALYRASLEKAVLEEELVVARKIQQNLLPAHPPDVPGFEIAACNVPSQQVGGDFYDLVDLGEGRILLAIADVSGKGVPAALLTSMLQASLRTQLKREEAPGVMLRNLNEMAYQFTAPDQFATFFLGILDSASGEFVYSNAGHNFPILVARDGAFSDLAEGGLLLGAFPDLSWPEGRVRLAPGDALLLYTDGITEARPPHLEEEYGERRFTERLTALLGASAAVLLQDILTDVTAYAGGTPQDDVTLVIVRRALPPA